MAALAARQWGVVSRPQLRAVGLSATMVRDRVRGGRLLPLHPGVCAVGHGRLRWEGHRLAAVLAVGSGAVAREAFERDRARDAALTAAGWRVVRFTHRQVAGRPDAVVETLRRLGIG